MRHRTTFLLKVRLLSVPQVVITDVPVVRRSGQEQLPRAPLIAARTVALVFVSGVNDAVVRAVNYARALRAFNQSNSVRAFNAKVFTARGRTYYKRGDAGKSNLHVCTPISARPGAMPDVKNSAAQHNGAESGFLPRLAGATSPGLEWSHALGPGDGLLVGRFRQYDAELFTAVAADEVARPHARS